MTPTPKHRPGPFPTHSLLALTLLAAVLTTALSSDDANPAAGFAPPPASATKFEFQAEVSRLMDILINSLYSQRDIFLRELISNASDALDKIRFIALTSPKALETKEELEIRIRVDRNNSVVEIRDTGIGMTKDDLMKNLGTIAKSGTSSFLDKLGDDGAAGKDLIGQFGVGFYSSYLVADKVMVTSKHNDDKQYVWMSSADDGFLVYEDKDGEPLGRGTKIALHLKKDASDFLETSKLIDLIKKHSQFIQFPIYVEVEEEKDVELTEEELAEQAAKRAAEEEEKKKEKEEAPEGDEEVEVKDEDDDEDDDEDEEEEEELAKTKKVTVTEWNQVNSQKPLWLRDPDEVTEDEHDAFYRAIANDPMPGKLRAKSHFKAEGEIEFRSILYIPDAPPVDLQNTKDHDKTNIKLFIRRVLVKDIFEKGLLPKYLYFIVGLVDSDDLPINVSRELLQNSKALDAIRRKLVRKALEMIRGIMTSSIDDDEEKSDEDEGDKEDKESKVHPYIEFWKKYGLTVKFGIVDDEVNRNRITKLLRYKSTKTDMDDENDLMSLDDYVSRMKEGQKTIYYLTGESKDQIKNSPFLEKLLQKDYEVVLMTDVMDDYVVSYMKDYDGHTFTNIAKENFKFSDEDQKEEKEKIERLKKSFKPLTKFMKTTLAEKVSKVKLSTRLTSSPCAISADQFGYSARMETIMRAQAFAENKEYIGSIQQKIMELNPYHPIIRKLGLMVHEEGESEEAKNLAHMIFDTALISSGYYVDNPQQYQLRMQTMVAKALDVDADGKLSEEPLFETEEEKKEEVEEVTLEDDEEGAEMNINLDDAEQEDAGDGKEEL